MKKRSVKSKPKSNPKQLVEEQKVKKLPSYMHGRFVFCLSLIGIMSAALVAKSVDLQVVRSQEMIKEANGKSIGKIDVPFTRGRILDRNGRVLSISVPMYTLVIEPKKYFIQKLSANKVDTEAVDPKLRYQDRWLQLAKEMESSPSKIKSRIKKFIDQKQKFNPKALFELDSDEYWQLLAKITDLGYTDLVEKVRKNPHSTFVKLEKQRINLEKRKLQELAKSIDMTYNELINKLYATANIDTIYIARHKSETVGEYAKALKIDHLVLESKTRRFYPMAEEAGQLIGHTDIDNKVGNEGLERSFNSLLVGKDGKRLFRHDAKGKMVEHIRDEKQYDPQDMVLSIDEELQSMAYREIKKAVVENNAESGTAVLVDIQTGEILAMATAPSYNPNNRSNFKPEQARNRAITDTFEPGSTVKPLVILTALQNKATYLSEVINTRPFVVNGHTITDVSKHESLTLTGILQKSSNIGVSRLALRMPPTALVDTYSKVGFGKDTGLGLGEKRGTNGDRKRWADVERATMAYGYGLNVTPLQLARAYATLGSFGIYRPLSITKVDPPVIGERVLPEKITREVVHMMESVAQKGEGGAKAAVDGFRVAIKTGTARKLEKGKYVEKYIAYTAGVAPASDPRFALVVLINEPKAGNYYGGAVSAPLFSSIMGYALKARNIKPDNLTEESRNAIREIKPNLTN